MSRKYKFHNKSGIYFVSFACVYWIDIFTRETYMNELIESLEYCQTNKGMEIYAYCIMPNHVHLVFSATENNPETVLGKYNEYTAKKIIKNIEENNTESRKEWILNMMENAGKTSSNITKYQFWQHHNKPIELYSNEVIEQKVTYIHNNPIAAGFVTQAEHWKYSSAINYTGNIGILNINLLW